jgi:two-component system, NarL family, nitrate/nitrite response regulator NarL
VGQVENGLRVLDAVRQYNPDLVLLDLNMPGQDGLATLQQLHRANLNTRVILLTRSDDEAVFANRLQVRLLQCRAEACRGRGLN